MIISIEIHWIVEDERINQISLQCSNCMYRRLVTGNKWYPKYCERCGSEMYKSFADMYNEVKE